MVINPPGLPGVSAASGPSAGGYLSLFSLKNSGVAPVGATPSALMPTTFLACGSKISACVSPPQLTSSYIVQTAASMAQAASTALPPCSKMRAPAVAPSGLPVMATQCRPCKTGLCVAEYGSGVAATHKPAMNSAEMPNEDVCIVASNVQDVCDDANYALRAGHRNV